jgi:methyl-accepting chemotaxis protein
MQIEHQPVAKGLWTMNLLSHLKVRTKLALLLGLSTLALVISIGAASSLMRARMVDDRIDKLRAVVQSTIGIAQLLETRVTAGQLSREQALSMLRDDVHAIRFDAGNGYVFARTPDNIVVLHGGTPALEGKPSLAANENGRLLGDMISEVLRDSNEGVVPYKFAKPGQQVLQPKITYVARFAPWDLVFAAGAYLDDLDAAYHASLLRLGSIGGVILAITLSVAWLVNRDITGSLNSLKVAMERLAQNELAIAIPGTTRRDEMGGMAKAVLVFKDNALAVQRLRTEQEQERQHAETEKRAVLTAMAATIETETGALLEQMRLRTTAMTATADAMSGSADRTGAAAETAAGAAGQAMANAQSVAGAAEQLTASIREIGGQMSQSAAVVSRAVTAGTEARATIEALNQQVERIGAVADMIGEIAAKTNLLALNATIEAARAGDAGKGFAVVASEVKALANQTARSTQEIAQHINQVRAATGASVAAVARIEQTITEVNAIAGSIAAAVEQQGAATAEIARNVTETATAANEMTTRTTEVSTEAGESGRQATKVRENATGLSDAMEELHHSVIRAVRTATTEVDRRTCRRRPCLIEATVSHEGQSETGSLHDISERGCYVVTKLRCQLGRQVTVALSSLGKRLQGTVSAQGDDGLHFAFSGEGLSAAEADRISLETTAELVKLAKGDHVAFVNRVADAVTTGGNLPSASLATHHHCRFGRWHDHIADPATTGLPSFKAMDEPHRHVHDSGKRALVALEAGDMPAAQRLVIEMRQHSERVLSCLDEFGRAYPGTIGLNAAEASKAA